MGCLQEDASVTDLVVEIHAIGSQSYNWNGSSQLERDLDGSDRMCLVLLLA